MMNPLTKVKLINELNQREAELGVKETVSWHSEYKDSAWIFIGGFPYELTEGDVICVFSQYGEIANINLVRDNKTGKSKGFCFICYEDQRSTILAVDNFNGIKLKGRTIRVDHVKNYRPPKDSEDIDDVTKRLREEGCAPRMPSPSSPESEEEEHTVTVKKQKKEKKKKKKEKKEKKKVKEERRHARSCSAQTPPPALLMSARVKREEEDPGYEKYSHQEAPEDRPREEGRRTRPDRDHREDAGLHGDQAGGAGRERRDEGRAGGRERDGEPRPARDEEREDEAWRRGRHDDGTARERVRDRDRERDRRDHRQWKSGGHSRDRSETADRERDRPDRGREHSRDAEHRRK
ncbi:RNA-binding motif protein, X-linked 2 [Lepisosteus oculatus]|uniref:RNA-binding motif protein, X-linked 2 n=1 Tax=Lepisosteus oculatus TaxID=7918 RepID=UPI00371CF4E1